MQDRHPEGHAPEVPGELPLAWAQSGTVVTSAALVLQTFLRAQVGWVLWWESVLRAVRTRPGVSHLESQVWPKALTQEGLGRRARREAWVWGGGQR